MSPRGLACRVSTRATAIDASATRTTFDVTAAGHQAKAQASRGSDLGLCGEPPKGIEPLTYALRGGRGTPLAAPPARTTRMPPLFAPNAPGPPSPDSTRDST